jgi:hypothetical protein
MIQLSRSILHNMMQQWQKTALVEGLREAWPVLDAEGGLSVNTGRGAAVYQLGLPDGTSRAVRFFTEPPADDMAERYALIDPYLAEHLPDNSVRSTFHHTGLRYIDRGQGFKIPLLEMEWVAGEPLGAAAGRMARHGRRAELAELAGRVAEMFAAMRAAAIAHSDLAGNNIMVRPDGTPVLIDYDGLYVPALAGRRPTNFGQPPYQHRAVAERSFDAAMDDYAQLVLITALTALSRDPALWLQLQSSLSGRAEENTDRLLFTAECHHEPRRSAVFTALRGHRDSHVRVLADALCRAAEGPLSDVTVPAGLLVASYRRQAAHLSELEQILTAQDQQQLAHFDRSSLADFLPAQPILIRLAALERFNHAVRHGPDTELLAAFTAVTALGLPTTAEMQQQIAAAEQREAWRRELRELLADGDDELIVIWRATVVRDPADDLGWLALEPTQLRQLQAAEQREAARAALATALQSDDDTALIAAGALMTAAGVPLRAPDAAALNAAQQREQLRAEFDQLAAAEDDVALTAWPGAVRLRLPGAVLDRVLSPTRRSRLIAAQARVAAMARLRAALADDDLSELMTAAAAVQQLGLLPAAVDPAAEAALAAAERTLAHLAQLRDLLAVLPAHADLAAVSALTAADPRLRRMLAAPEAAQLAAIEREAAALAALRRSLTLADEAAAARQLRERPHLAGRLTAEQRAAAELAAERLAYSEALRAALDSGSLLRITEIYRSDRLRSWMPLTYADLALLDRAQRAQQPLGQLRTALAAADDPAAVVAARALTALLPGGAAELPAALHDAAAAAQRRIAVVERFAALWAAQRSLAALNLLQAEREWLPNYRTLSVELRGVVSYLQRAAEQRDRAAAALREGRDRRALELAAGIEDAAIRASLGPHRLQLAQTRAAELTMLEAAVARPESDDRDEAITRVLPAVLAHPELPLTAAQRRAALAARQRVLLRERFAALPARFAPTVADAFRHTDGSRHDSAADREGSLEHAIDLRRRLDAALAECSAMSWNAHGERILRLTWPSDGAVTHLAVAARRSSWPPRPELLRDDDAAAVPALQYLSRSQTTVNLGRAPFDWYVLIVAARLQDGRAADSRNPADYLFSGQVFAIVVADDGDEATSAAAVVPTVDD